MGPHYLRKIFAPSSVAVIGASPRPDSVGNRVLKNIIDAGYDGELFVVNPKHAEVLGRPCVTSVEEITEPVDLAVVVTPAATVPGIIRQCGEQGVKGAVVLSAGFREVGEAGQQLEEELLHEAKRFGIRLVGPNCLGLMRTSIGLNATFSHTSALQGELALVSQSGALCTSILDWALENRVGFSSMVSMGAAADVGFGEVLDYLAVDPETKSILLYIEGIGQARQFMSGLRVAARMKPVVVVKAGRFAEGSRAAVSHTGSLVGADDVFDAALRRAGVVRVLTVDQLFSAAQILSSGCRARGNRLAVVTNAGGPGVLAADHAVERAVEMSRLQDSTIATLDACMPPQWSHDNPVDVLGDAPPARYRDAIAAVQADDNVDGTVVLFVPQAMSDADEVAEQVIDAASQNSKPLITSWLGEQRVKGARQLFSDRGVPSFRTPESAVEAFSYLARYHRNQQLLLQVPEPLSAHSEPDVEGARLIVEGALADGRRVLGTLESKALLSAFRIPTMHSILAQTANDALVAAESLGFPVALKINARDITHKSDVGGVRLNIDTAHSVRGVFKELVDGVRAAYPDAQVDGVTVEKMCRKPAGRELMIGVVRDPVFGPTISFGAGGIAVEIMQDNALALPPLNEFIIDDLIGRTRVAKLLGAFRGAPPADIEAIESVLLRVSSMVCELPHIVELDINPLIVDDAGAMAVDARVVIDDKIPHEPYAHMAVHPYPAHLIDRWQLADGTDMVIRPIRPEDAAIEDNFVRNLSPESKYFRFMQALQELTPQMLVRFTQIDYDREMAFIATTNIDGAEAEVAVGRYVTNPDGRSCEFALVVGDEWTRRGIGARIMRALFQVAKGAGLDTMEGEILSSNSGMLTLVKKLGFTVRPCKDDVHVQRASRPL